MTAAIPTPPQTALQFLFGSDQHQVDALGRALDERGVGGTLEAALQQLSESGRAAAREEVAGVTQGVLDLDLADFVVAGWRKHAALAAAADRTAANPGSTEVVDLATHRITSVHQPSIELLVNGVRVATLHFELKVELVIRALVAIVRDGHVVGLRSGVCDLTATLAAEGVPLASRQGHLDLPLAIRWPLRLHGGADRPPAGAARPARRSPPSRPRTPLTRQHGRQRAWRPPPAD